MVNKKTTNQSNNNHAGLEEIFLRLRKQYRLTQADLAELLKVSKNYICQIETGRKVPSQSLVQLVQRVEKELALNPPPRRIEDAAENSPLDDNPASEYMRRVWAAARNDKHLEGYIVTKLKLEFPLDKPPFRHAAGDGSPRRNVR